MNEHAQQFSLAGHDFSALEIAQKIEKTFAALVEDTNAPMPWLHAASNSAPPTNRWFSGLAFGSPAPVFPMPYSYMQTDQGFVFGLPHVMTSRHTVSGLADPAIDVNVGACGYRISEYDLASVTIEFLNEIGRVLGRAVLAQGVPYVSYTAEVAHDLALSESFAMTYETLATAWVEGRHFGVVTTGMFSARSIRLQPGQFVSLIALPDFSGEGAAVIEQEVLRVARHAAFPVLRTEVSAQVHDHEVVTSIRYVARENGPVAVVKMPHHGSVAADVLGAYTTVAGRLELVSAKVMQWSTRRLHSRSAVSLANVPKEHRDVIAQAVSQEIALEPRAPQDTYFAGKSFFRDANLLILAEELGVQGADSFADGLESRFLEWFRTDLVEGNSKSFYYDDVWCGVNGREASFGADVFDEHLSQWGYFIHVAATLGARNPSVLETVRETVDALVFDVATPVGGLDVPTLRSFDVYRGHSWASGTSAFDEGNYQGSNNEAVTAWNAIALWANLTDQLWLADLATWLLSLEAQSATTYWTNFDLSDPVYSAYKHSFVPTVWGGKHDFAAGLSGETAANLGGVLLPLGPVSSYLAFDPARVAMNVEEAVGFFADYDQAYGDYMLMYSALAGVEAARSAWEIGVKRDVDGFDDGNSKAQTLAWIAEQLVSE